MARARRGRSEGSIFKRADGLWVGSVSIGYNAAGRRRRKTVYGHTKREVQDKLRAVINSSPSPDFERMTVGEYLDRWLANSAKSSVSPTTFQRYEQCVRLKIKPLIGTVRLDKLAPMTIAEMFVAMERNKYSRRAQQMCGMVLGRALREAVRLRLIPHNPASDVDKPTPAERPMMTLDTAQAQALLRAAEADRLHALYVLAVGTGMRLGEICALSWSDVDFDAGAVSVQRSLEEIGGRHRLKETKTAKGRRRIDLPRFVMDALAEHRKRMLAEGHTAGPVFCDRRGGWLRRSNFRRTSWRPLLKAAGLPSIRFHDLRHTAASLLLLQGVHPKVVSERLGHARVEITLNRYSHVLPTLQREAADKLDRLLG